MAWIEDQFGKYFLKAQKAFFPSEKDLVSKKEISQFDTNRYSHLLFLLSGKDIKVRFSPISYLYLTNTDIYFPQSIQLKKNFDSFLFYLVIRVAEVIGLHEVEKSNLLVAQEDIDLCNTLIDGLKRNDKNNDLEIYDFSKKIANSSIKESLKAQAVPNPNSVDLSSTPDNPLIHMFEKVQTAEEYDNGSRSIEDAESLSSESQALDEVLFGTVIRTHETSSGMLETEISIGNQSSSKFQAPPPHANFRYYKEWFANESKYHDQWCKVFINEWSESLKTHSKKDSSPDNGYLAKRLKLELEFCFNVARIQKRRPNGDDLDFDAVVNARADCLATGISSSHIYEQRKKLERDFGILFLIDKSMSTDAWHSEGRVIDLIQESLIIFEEAFREIKENIQVDLFHSFTRNDCHYENLKKFGDSWENWPKKVYNIEPEGYTRIGPAIRHATSILQNKVFKKKLLIIFSDCKPTDYDAYEGSHGLADVQKAIHEAEIIDIHCFAFVLTKQFEPWTLKMFRNGKFANIKTTSQLIDEITKVLRMNLK